MGTSRAWARPNRFGSLRRAPDGSALALRLPTIVRNLFIAASEGNRLEAQETNGLGIVQGKLNNAAHLLIVDAVDDGGNRNDIDTIFMQVVNGAQLHVKQIADLAMRVGSVADPSNCR